MRQTYSRTAEAAALARSLQQTLPASQRILDDPFAPAFLQHPYLRFVASSRLHSLMLSRFLDFWATGAQEFVAIRARLADDLAKELVRDGLKQLVLLGAGFDSMVLRIKDALRGVRVFEVDHPATQTVKRQVMAQYATPDNLRFVAVDFEQDDFVEKLKEAGLDPRHSSLIICMGVSYYLTPQAMDRALTQISLLGGAGTYLAFDYILQKVIEGTTQNLQALNAMRHVALLEEPWIFGLKPGEAGDYLAAFGLKLIKDYQSKELYQVYCPNRFNPMDYARIIVCKRASAL